MEFNLNLFEAWDSLNEIYEAEFNRNDNDDFYHFYSSIKDLLNSLQQKTIYSIKNERPTQFDRYATGEQSYICMTTGLEGKKRIVSHYNRPYGISFTKEALEKFCKAHHHQFNPNKSYNQFSEKAVWKDSTSTPYRPTFDLKDFSDFEIFAIGELSEGEYFISGGQGPKNIWKAVRFYDKALYETLRNWFLENLKTEDNKHKYYWFKDNFIGEPTQIWKDNIINVSGNLNKNYKPRLDTPESDEEESDTKKRSTKEPSYNRTINFGTKMPVFKEILGLGPIDLRDDKGNTILYLMYVKAGSLHGYSGPNLYGRKITNEFEKTDKLVLSNPAKSDNNSTQLNLIASRSTMKKLSDLYNENEYRIYLHNKKDFYFEAADIKSIVLPAQLKYAKSSTVNYIMDLTRLIHLLASNKVYDTTLPAAVFLKTLYADGVLQVAPNKDAKYALELYRICSSLINLLQTTYKNVEVEIIPNKTVLEIIDTNLAFNSAEDSITDLPARKDLKGKTHIRWLTSQIPDFSEAKIVEWHNYPSVIAPVVIRPGEEPELARIGSEIILTGFDAQNNKYVLFVENAYKSDNFLELPGGGLEKIPYNSLGAFEDLVYHRLDLKCGITKDQIKNLTDVGQALLLYEKGITADKSVSWDWSYYWLFTAQYTPVLNVDRNISLNRLSYNHKNERYLSYLKWIPVDNIALNNAITSRYSNIINLIRNN